MEKGRGDCMLGCAHDVDEWIQILDLKIGWLYAIFVASSFLICRYGSSMFYVSLFHFSQSVSAILYGMGHYD